jgi:NAD(P)-dependent dehydrogenase (short-subunit alcohol dehydrogenase family)
MKSKYNPFNLIGKNILITGASSGIGRSIAIECSKMGANLIITGRNKRRLEEVAISLSTDSFRIIIADLTNTEDLNNLCSQIDSLSGLVYSSGIIKALPFKFFDQKYIDEVMDINFKSAVLLTSKLAKDRRFLKPSSIVFISSISGNLVSSTANAAYSASKAALNGVVKGMALELAPGKIRVNTIMPGIVRTKLLSDIPMDEEQMASDIKKYPLGYGEPIDVALAAVYLLSDASKWITGSNIILDGGYTLL